MNPDVIHLLALVLLAPIFLVQALYLRRTVPKLPEPKTWLLRQEVLLWRIRERFDNPHLYLCGVPPVGQFPALPQPLRWWLGLRAKTLTEALGL